MISINTVYDLVAIIECLLNGIFDLHGDNLNTRLLSFMDDNASWELCLQTLLECQNTSVRYFAANMLLSKSRSQWITLPRDAQMHLLNSINHIAKLLANSPHYHPEKPLRDKVFSTLCVMALSSDGYVDNTLNTAKSLITDHQPADETEYYKMCNGLDILCSVASEAELLEIPRRHLHSVQNQLREGTKGVLQCLCETISLNLGDETVLLSLLHAMHAWCKYGITLSILVSEFPRLLNALVDIASSSTGKSAPLALQVLCDIVCTLEYPAPDGRYNIIRHILDRLTTSPAVCESYDLHSVCLSICTIAEQESQNLASPTGFSSHVFEFILQCAAAKPRSIAVLTFDFWIAIQDIPSKLKHESCKSAFGSLLDKICDQLEYTDDFDGMKWKDAFSEEEENFNSFRNTAQGIDDVLNACFYALGDVFFQIIAARIWDQNGSFTSWRKLETALFILSSISDEVKKIVAQNADDDTLVVIFLEKLICDVLRERSAEHSVPQLSIAACNFFGSIVYLFSADHPLASKTSQYFPSAVSYLSACVSQHNADAAANGLLRLSQVCAYLFRANIDVFSEITMVACQLIAQCDNSMVITVVMAQSTAAASLVSDAKLQIIEHTTNVIRQCIMQEFHLFTQRSPSRLVQLLRIMHAQIRHSENFESTSDAAFAFLLAFAMTQCIEVLQFAHHRRSSVGDVGYELILGESFAVFSAVIKCKSDEKVSYIPQICEFIVNCCRERIHSGCFQCAYDVVETLSSQKEAERLLFDLLQNIVQNVTVCIDKGDIDVQAAEKLYGYMSLCFVLTPQVIIASSALLEAIYEFTGKLIGKYSEIQAVRNILTFIQHCFTPLHVNGTLVNCDFIRVSSMKYLPVFIAYILDGIDGALPSSAWPYLADTMYSIISSTEICKLPDTNQLIASEIMASHRFRRIPNEEKRIVSAITINLAGRNKRKFKTAYVDLGKVCAGEMNVEMLHDYTLL